MEKTPFKKSAEQLFAAAKQLRKIGENLLLVEGETLSDECAAGLKMLGDVLEDSAETLKKTLHIDITPYVPDQTDHEEANLSLDASKIQRAVEFSRKISSWLHSLKGREIPSKAKMLLRELGAAALFAGKQAHRLHHAHVHALHSGIRIDEDTGPVELLLVHGKKDPLLKEWQGRLELNTKAENLIREFLESVAIERSPREFRDLKRKVENWIKATPTGMVLVLRIGQLKGKPDVFPKYLKKEKLQQEQ